MTDRPDISEMQNAVIEVLFGDEAQEVIAIRDEAIRQERERCAKTLDDEARLYGAMSPVRGVIHSLAQRIRAGKEPTK